MKVGAWEKSRRMEDVAHWRDNGGLIEETLSGGEERKSGEGRLRVQHDQEQTPST